MTTSTIRVGDIIEVDKKGRTFYAKRRVPKDDESLRRGEIAIRPLDARMTYFTATGREIVGHYKATKETARRMGVRA